jgi:myo-inositol-1(or 4)-monophosphatase
LEIAKQAAREAGAYIRANFHSDIEAEEKTSSFDVVTEVDIGSEKLIKQFILERCPQHAFLGEEEIYVQGSLDTLLDKGSELPYMWIVDPIDGTSNFVHGLPGFSVSIALACHGVLIIGVVYDPLRDILYWAEKGKGAWCDGKPIRVSDTDNLARSIVSTGFPSEPKAREAVLSSMQEIGKRSRTVRSFGSAALHLAYVAAGKLGAYWQYGLSVWDIAAGILLVQEAGGRASNLVGEDYRLTDKDVLATNSKHHSELLTWLKPLDRSR